MWEVRERECVGVGVCGGRDREGEEGCIGVSENYKDEKEVELLCVCVCVCMCVCVCLCMRRKRNNIE